VSNDQNSALEPWLQTLWDQGGSTSYSQLDRHRESESTANSDRLTVPKISPASRSMTSRSRSSLTARGRFSKSNSTSTSPSRGVTRLVYEAASSPLAGRPHWPYESFPREFPVLKNLACPTPPIGCPSSRAASSWSRGQPVPESQRPWRRSSIQSMRTARVTF